MSQLTILAVNHSETIIWVVLGLLAAMGLLAIVSPRWFASLATRSGHWVDTDKVLARLDHRVDVDRLILPYSRYLGVAVVLAAGLLGALYANH